MHTSQLPVRLPDLEDPHPEYASRPVPAHCFPLHILGAVIGGRGSGKTTFALKLVKMYDRAKSFDRIVVFSTTADKDPKMKAFLQSRTFAELTPHHGYSDAALQGELDRMQADIEAFRKYLEDERLWKKFVARDHDVDKMTYDEVCRLHELDFEPPRPPNKSGRFPCHLIVFDDLVGTPVFRANMSGTANRLLISHRHYSCSVLILSQTFQCFIPKQVRANNIGLWVLFGTKCEKTMEDIAQDVSSKVSPQDFVAAWRYATRKPHTPFVCDYDTHDDSMRFREGLDKVIHLGAAGSDEKSSAPAGK